jgi:hypothetical protein
MDLTLSLPHSAQLPPQPAPSTGTAPSVSHHLWVVQAPAASVARHKSAAHAHPERALPVAQALCPVACGRRVAARAQARVLGNNFAAEGNRAQPRGFKCRVCLACCLPAAGSIGVGRAHRAAVALWLAGSCSYLRTCLHWGTRARLARAAGCCAIRPCTARRWSQTRLRGRPPFAPGGAGGSQRRCEARGSWWSAALAAAPISVRHAPSRSESGAQAGCIGGGPPHCPPSDRSSATAVGPPKTSVRARAPG